MEEILTLCGYRLTFANSITKILKAKRTKKGLARISTEYLDMM